MRSINKWKEMEKIGEDNDPIVKIKDRENKGESQIIGEIFGNNEKRRVNKIKLNKK